MNITPINFNSEVQSLLSSEDLPFEDLLTLNNVELFGVKHAEKLLAMIGIEYYEELGFVRSLAVYKSARGEGYGKRLVEFLEVWSLKNDIKDLYLLTTTAESYFTGLGFGVLDRKDAPSSIAATKQFSGLCPSSAILMSKKIF